MFPQPAGLWSTSLGFSEQRLIDLVWEHRHQPLARISEIVTAAVDDWIGANEQPDDITLVLARVR